MRCINAFERATDIDPEIEDRLREVGVQLGLKMVRKPKFLLTKT